MSLDPITVSMTVQATDMTASMEAGQEWKLPITLETLSAAANGSYSAPSGKAYDKVNVAVPGPSGSISISANGSYDVEAKATALVAVPNSYSAADEGKVVSNGTLVGQTARTVNANGTYDTTTNDSVTVAVPTVEIPAGIEVGSFTVASNANTITINHGFGHVPKIAAVIAALPEGWRSTLFFEYLGSSPASGDYSDSYTAAQKLNSVTGVALNSGAYNYQTTATYTTYPAAMTETSITFATGRYYGAQFVPGVTYFYVIGG